MHRDLIIGFHINPRSTQDLRRWPHFSELADKFIEMGAWVIFTGTEQDSAYVRKVISKVKRQDKCIDLTEKLTVNELACWLKVCTLLVTVNSFPMHLGIALGTPTLAIIGGTPADVVAPKDNHKFRYLEDPALVKHPHYKPQMEKITINEVLTVAREMLN